MITYVMAASAAAYPFDLARYLTIAAFMFILAFSVREKSKTLSYGVAALGVALLILLALPLVFTQGQFHRPA